jgi:hypothetical protein
MELKSFWAITFWFNIKMWGGYIHMHDKCSRFLTLYLEMIMKVIPMVVMEMKMTHSQLLEGLKCESKWKTTEEGGVETRSLAHNTLRGRGACWSSRMGLGRIDKFIHSHGPAHNPHKVVNA